MDQSGANVRWITSREPYPECFELAGLTMQEYGRIRGAAGECLPIDLVVWYPLRTGSLVRAHQSQVLTIQVKTLAVILIGREQAEAYILAVVYATEHRDE